MSFATRKSAAQAGATRYFTGKPCSRGHVAQRGTLNGGCVECSRGNQKRLRHTAEYRDRRNAQLQQRRASGDELLKLRERVSMLQSRDKRAAWGARWRQSPKGIAHRNKAVAARHGLNVADYDRMLTDQCGKCAICDASKPGHGRKRFAVDHDHQTGHVRGLLCHSCNTGIGLLRDSIVVLLSAARYLERSHA